MTISVAILVYPDSDILDIAGPLGILSTSTLHDNAFSFTILAQHELTKTCSHMRIPRDMSLDHARQDNILSSFDVLLVPGGSLEGLTGIAQDAESAEVQFVKAFASIQLHHKKRRPRTVFSVCSGALMLATAGVLVGKTVTTHHLALDALRKQCAKHAGPETTVVEECRYQDGGLTENGVRVLTAAGVSAGMDAACYFIAREFGVEQADCAARMNEYEWEDVYSLRG
ncbi:uncharacterized protein TRUGW13939_02878 [Talaromyces rugulosus]|uniref:DJ-1/PfpI domain-containing protein n=1 Tax=Talaromyces rugulosus TaxID=121627 RepID=A0A7H8QP84_TALRU|nr:uncharacterized protein TRUGW13939_02878 [Talaromyces rugulosus]QKX55780.1 hypothetical protein TRUGW13939_02878 [Talaromyces rugulosus]